MHELTAINMQDFGTTAGYISSYDSSSISMQQHIVAQPEEFNIEATTPCSPTSEEYNHEYDVNMSQEVSMETDSSRIAHPYD